MQISLIQIEHFSGGDTLTVSIAYFRFYHDVSPRGQQDHAAMRMDKLDKSDTLERSDYKHDKKHENGSARSLRDKRLDKLDKSDTGSIKSERLENGSAKADRKSDKTEKVDRGESGSLNGLVNGEVASEDGEGEEKEDLLDEEREKLIRVLSGELEDLPPLGSKIVRIFTSSTFTGK